MTAVDSLYEVQASVLTKEARLEQDCYWYVSHRDEKPAELDSMAVAPAEPARLNRNQPDYTMESL